MNIKLIGLLILCFFCVDSLVHAENSLNRQLVESPLPLQNTKFTIFLGEDFTRSPDTRVRVRNLVNGKEIVIGSLNSSLIHLTEAQIVELTDNKVNALKPEISVLVYKSSQIKMLESDEVLKNFGSSISKSLVYDQPVWQGFGFQTQRGAGFVKIELLENAHTVILETNQSEIKEIKMSAFAIQKLFTMGWKSIKLARYDLSYEAFSKITSYAEANAGKFPKKRLAEAHLGRAISLYNQKGCAQISPDLVQADKQPEFRDDVTFYKARCFKDAKKNSEAIVLFQVLVGKQHPKYAELSKFYLGVIADEANNFEEAESTYLDLIDFSSNKELVAVVKVRLADLKKRKEEYFFEHKWITAVLSNSFGYDSNVVSIPGSVLPSSLGLSNRSSTGMMNILYVEFQPPYKAKVFNHKLAVTGVNVYNFDALVGAKFDLQTYDVASRFEWILAPQMKLDFGFSYASVFLGPLSTSGEYQGGMGLDAKLKTQQGKASDPESDTEYGTRYIYTIPKVVATTGDLNSRANALSLSWKKSYKTLKPNVYGPDLSVEYKLAQGKENSYYAGTTAAFWTRPILSKEWQLNLTQNAGLITTRYFQITSRRMEYNLKYSVSVGRPWGRFFETSIQSVGIQNLSNSAAKQYQKLQLNLLVSAVY